jgi:hypothetical protein
MRSDFGPNPLRVACMRYLTFGALPGAEPLYVPLVELASVDVSRLRSVGLVPYVVPPFVDAPFPLAFALPELRAFSRAMHPSMSAAGTFAQTCIGSFARLAGIRSLVEGAVDGAVDGAVVGGGEITSAGLVDVAPGALDVPDVDCAPTAAAAPSAVTKASVCK